MAYDREKVNNLAKDILKVAGNTLMIHLRFMDKSISMLSYESVEGLGGVEVDGEKIYYDPVYILKRFSEEKKIIARQYLHMVLHCVYHHFWISLSVNRDYWDLACDIAVEYTIHDMDLSFADTGHASAQSEEFSNLKEKVKYMTADMLYKYFLSGEPSEHEIRKWRKLFSMDKHDIWYDYYYASKQEVLTESRQRNAEGKSGQKNQQQNRSDNQDGKSDNQERRSDNTEGKSDSKEGTSDRKGVWSENSLHELRRKLQEWSEVARQMKMDMETFSKTKGEKAGALSQNLMAVTRETYDYTEFLKKFAVLGERMKINDDEFDYIFYTYGMQLYGKMPLIEPLEYKDVKQIKEFVIAIDTSGSTSGELVQAFIQKTYNILKSEESFSTRFNLHMIQCDVEIQEDVKITNQNEFDEYLSSMKILGQGGTDFRPVFSYVDELIHKGHFTNLKGLIYFTDGFGTFPEKQPDYKVAFVYVEEGYENPEVPVWAIKLVLNTEDIKGEPYEH